MKLEKDFSDYTKTYRALRHAKVNPSNRIIASSCGSVFDITGWRFVTNVFDSNAAKEAIRDYKLAYTTDLDQTGEWPALTESDMIDEVES